MLGRKGSLYLSMLENITDGVYFVGENRKVTFWNRAAEHMTGIAAAEIVGTSIDEGKLIYEDAGGHVLQPFEYAVALCLQEKKTVSRNLFINAGDNGRIPVEEHASPIMTKGKLTGVIASFKDVTQCIVATEQRIKTEKQRTFNTDMRMVQENKKCCR